MLLTDFEADYKHSRDLVDKILISKQDFIYNDSPSCIRGVFGLL